MRRLAAVAVVAGCGAGSDRPGASYVDAAPDAAGEPLVTCVEEAAARIGHGHGHVFGPPVVTPAWERTWSAATLVWPTVAIDAAGGVVVCDGADECRAYTATGAPRWTIDGDAYRDVAVDDAGNVYALGNGGLRVVTAAGADAWTAEVVGVVAVRGDHVAAIGHDGELVRMTTAGDVVTRCASLDPLAGELEVTRDGRLLFTTWIDGLVGDQLGVVEVSADGASALRERHTEIGESGISAVALAATDDGDFAYLIARGDEPISLEARAYAPGGVERWTVTGAAASACCEPTATLALAGAGDAALVTADDDAQRVVAITAGGVAGAARQIARPLRIAGAALSPAGALVIVGVDPADPGGVVVESISPQATRTVCSDTNSRYTRSICWIGA